MTKVLFIRCRESVEPDIFRLVEEQLKELAGKNVECETLDVISLNYLQGSYLKNIFDKEIVRYVEKVVRKKKPDIIVSGNDVAISAAFIKICNLLGISSLVIQHGILTKRENRDIMDFLRWSNYLPWRIVSSIANMPTISKLTLSMGWRTRVLDWGTGKATKYAVMSNNQKRLLISQGVQPRKIVVTGYPPFDLVPKRISSFDRRATCKELGIGEDKPVVLFTTQPFVEDGVWSPKQRRLLTKTVIDSTKNLSLQLIIKVHPREDAKDYERLSKYYKEVVVTRDFNLHELLLISDVVITVSSTTGLWALVYGKPLAIVTCFPTDSYNVYEGVSYEINRLENLYETLISILKQDVKSSFPEKIKLFLQDYRLDGCASKRIAKEILDLVKLRVRGEMVC